MQFHLVPLQNKNAESRSLPLYYENIEVEQIEQFPFVSIGTNTAATLKVVRVSLIQTKFTSLLDFHRDCN